MKRTILTLALATQLAAGTAFAQATATDTHSSDTATGSQTFGSDWSTTLGLALFDEDGTTVRTDTEITAQWDTLSDEDKDMIRRDCTTRQTQSGDDTTTPAGDADIGAYSGDAAPDATSDAQVPTADDATADADITTPLSVSADQMDAICDATTDL